jgi:hypothetical protein
VSEDDRGREQHALPGGDGEQGGEIPPDPMQHDGNHRVSSGHVLDHDELAVELERQARELVQAVRESAGDLGTRVREALGHASSLWDEAHPGMPGPSAVSDVDERRARALAARWVARDFLVEPDLPSAMTVYGVESGHIWRFELRERGEVRVLTEGTEPYSGQRPMEPGPVLPVWDYVFPATPEIESGERRERLAGTGRLVACTRCNGTGHRPCAACEGKGFVPCPDCHGRAKLPCRRCRGRGHIADPDAERRARASKPYLQIQAERVALDARDRLADFAERLRQDYAVPLPPPHEWLPAAPASGVTIPCPDCTDGTVPCSCQTGKRACQTCLGSSFATCSACSGTGRVVRHKQVLRRFDTRIIHRTLPYDQPAPAHWVTPEMLKKAAGEDAWEGPLDALLASRPEEVPEEVWSAAAAFARTPGEPQASSPAAPDERRVISRRLRVSRVPLARVEYAFAGKPFSFVAVGRTGVEKFWAQEFPPRWSRVGRFLKALTRDLQSEGTLPPAAGSNGEQPRRGLLSSLEDFRRERRSADSGQTAGDED